MIFLHANRQTNCVHNAVKWETQQVSYEFFFVKIYVKVEIKLTVIVVEIISNQVMLQ